jgi:hypothetical protein
MDHEFDQAKNIKLLFCTFEQLSVFKINIYKKQATVAKFLALVPLNVCFRRALIRNKLQDKTDYCCKSV